jgi:hypothetical protein
MEYLLNIGCESICNSTSVFQRTSHTLDVCMYPFPFSWMSSFVELVVYAAQQQNNDRKARRMSQLSLRYSAISSASLQSQDAKIGFPDTAVPTASRKDYMVLASTLTIGRSLTYFEHIIASFLQLDSRSPRDCVL